jgi:hypothetical protein
MGSIIYFYSKLPNLDKAGLRSKVLVIGFLFQTDLDKTMPQKVPREVNSMEGNTANLVILLIWAVSILLAAFVVQGLMVRRAAFKVIRILRDNHSLCSEGYKTIDELGLRAKSFMERMFRFGLRDYKPYALQALIRAEIVRSTSDGKVCLLENKVQHILSDRH